MLNLLTGSIQSLARWGIAQLQPDRSDKPATPRRYFLVHETAVLGAARRSRRRNSDRVVLVLLLVGIMVLSFLLGILWAERYLNYYPQLRCRHAMAPLVNNGNPLAPVENACVNLPAHLYSHLGSNTQDRVYHRVACKS